ncbi:MAG TPA: hypothetical protein VKT77_14230, partial [Chthonomonadaceae bacterium]|nr:hypothetical protein [Chthonomonadaceae bacterium]
MKRREFLRGVGSAGILGAAGLGASVGRGNAAEREPDDPYARYVRTSEDFRRVRQDRAWLDRAFPGWVYMPWTYQWNIGYTNASGRWSLAHGYNGAFLDGNGGSPDSPPGKLAWIDKFRLHFYMDHTAGKGFLHMWDGDKQKPHLAELHGAGVRVVPVNDALRDKLRERIRTNVSQVKASPMRSAYALDDEISWGHFVHPTMWRVTDDAAAYPRWLREVYGPGAPERREWITYDAIRSHLPEWSVRDFDA